jgi:hypothetical protein
VTEVFETSKLLQTILFKTYSVFFALFVCFDDSMDFSRGYGDLLSYTNGSHGVLLSFM